MRNAFRDFFRRRRLARHVARNGHRYIYHGLEVEVPGAAGATTDAALLGVRNALLRQKYERDEAAMIMRHLPSGLPVIELGGSLGVVSRLLRSRLKPETPHLIVEANFDLIAICKANAEKGQPRARPKLSMRQSIMMDRSSDFGSARMSIPMPSMMKRRERRAAWSKWRR